METTEMIEAAEPAGRPALTVVEGRVPAARPSPPPVPTAPPATYRLSKVVVAPIYDKLVDGRKVAEIEGIKGLLFEDPTWGEALEKVLAMVTDTLTSEQR